MVDSRHPRFGPQSANSGQYTIKKIVENTHPTSQSEGNQHKYPWPGLNSRDLQHFELATSIASRDVVVSGNTFDVPLNNLKRIDGVLA